MQNSLFIDIDKENYKDLLGIDKSNPYYYKIAFIPLSYRFSFMSIIFHNHNFTHSFLFAVRLDISHIQTFNIYLNIFLNFSTK